MSTTATVLPLWSTFAESPRGLSGDRLRPGLVAAGLARPGPVFMAPGEGFAR